MDSTLNFLKEEANRIRKLQIDDFYLNHTDPLNIPINTFLNLFDIIQNLKDNDLTLGFCFSIGPYISNNRSVIKSKYSHDIWSKFITFSENINEPIQIFGFCEAVLTTSFCCLSIDQLFLDFLVDDKSLQSTILKPSLLVSLYSDFQVDFIPHQTKSLIPIITKYFVESIPMHCILNFYLVNSLNLSGEELKSYPNFENNFWSSLYRIISTYSFYFQMLLNPLFQFRKLNESFFSCSNEFISNKIDEIEKNSYDDVNMNRLLTLAYLLPFLSCEDIEKFMEKIIPIVSLYIFNKKKIPKELTKALNESKKLLGIYSVSMKLYQICSNLLETEFYPAVIYFLSIFLNAFNSYYPQCYNPIIEKFISGLESSYPIKFPLAFAFYEISKSISKMIHEDQTKKCVCHHHQNESSHQHSESDEKNVKKDECCQCHHHHQNESMNRQNENDEKSVEKDECCHRIECSENSKRFDVLLLKNRIIPSLLKISNSKNEADSHWAFKSLRSFMNFGCFDLFPSISDLFEFYSFHSETDFSANSMLCLHHFHKFLFDYINIIKSDEKKFPEVIQFVLNQLNFINLNKFESKSESTLFLIKTDFCILIRIICLIDSSCILKFFDFGMKLSNELFFSEYFQSYSHVIQLLSLFYKNKEFNSHQFVDKSLKIGKNEIRTSPLTRMEVVSHLVDFDFIKFSDISEIINLFLEENDKNTKDKFGLIALQIIEEYLKRIGIQNKQIKEVFDFIVSPFVDKISFILRSSRSENVVNKSFSILTIILDLQEQFFDGKNKNDDLQMKLNELFEDVIYVTLFGRIRLFDHSMCYNYSFLSPHFKFFSFASHFIAKNSKKLASRRITEDFILWILRVSNEVIPKLLKVLEISLAVKIVDKEMIEFLSLAVMSRINEDNWKLNFVEPCILFLKKLKEKFPAVFPLDSFLVCLEKAWEENQDDNEEIVKFLIPVFLQIFSEKSFKISGDFLVFQDISTIVTAESFDLNYPQILNCYVQMYQNKIPFDSFDRFASIVFAHFLTKNKSELIDYGFSFDELKTVHMILKRIFKNSKIVERFVDNFFKDNSVVLNRIKTIKKSPKLPEF